MLTKALGNHSGFGSRLDWLLELIEKDPYPSSKIASLVFTGRALAWIGRHDLAEKTFRDAHGRAGALPVMMGGEPGRFPHLLTTTQFAAEAGLWDLAQEFFVDMEKAGLEFMMLNSPNFTPADVRKALDFFRSAIKAKRLPKRAPLLDGK